MTSARAILVFFHCKSNTGYAIEVLEKAFFKAAMNFTNSIDNIHMGYLTLEGGRPTSLPDGFDHLIEIDTRNKRKENLNGIYSYIKKNKIDVAFGFDQPVSASGYKAMRQAGIRLFISYWGAPMSSLNSGIKLIFKRIEVYFRKYMPDHFIFESNAMAETAVLGRGIPSARTSIIPTGVDTEKYKPDPTYSDYAYNTFSIPKNRRIFVYTGHMEERKGVDTIIKAAIDLIDRGKRQDVHFLILGNRNQEELQFAPLYMGQETEKFITFGGYRQDIHNILPSCYAGVIASTGWDSFPMSSLEMAACGLPLIGSELQGLKETIENGVTGLLFSPGSSSELSEKISFLIKEQSIRNAMSIASRKRVVEGYSVEKQVGSLTNLLNDLYLRN